MNDPQNLARSLVTRLERGQQQSRALANTFALRDTNPDMLARARDAAGQIGVPAATADLAPQETIAQAEQRRRLEAMSSSPAMAAYFASQQNAAISHDDYEALATAGQSTGFVSGLVNSVARRSPRRAVNTFLNWQFERTLRREQDAQQSFGEILDDQMLGPTIPTPGELFGAGWRYLRSRVYSEETMAAATARRAQAAVEGQEALARIPYSEGSAAVLEQLDGAQTFEEALAIVARDPVATMMLATEVAGESATQIVGATAVTAATRSPTLGALFMGGASGALERFQEPISFLQAEGVDLSDPEAVRGLVDDPDLLSRARERGVTRGMIIGLADTLAGGLAGVSMSQNEIANLALQALVQGGLGAGGEAAATLAVGDDIRPGDVVLEALAEFVSAPADVAGIGGRAFLEQRQAQQAADAFVAAGEAAAATATANRSTAALREFLRQAVQDGEPAYLSPDGIRTLNQSGLDDPFLTFGIDEEEALAAAEAGHSIPVDVDRVVEAAANPAAREWVRSHVSAGEGSASLAEAQAAMERIEGEMRAEAERAAAAAAQEESERSSDQRVADDVARQLVSSGAYNRQSADGVAQLVAARYRVLADTLAAETGEAVDPYGLFLERTGGLAVERELPEALQRLRRDVDNLDTQLDQIRAGVPGARRGPSLMAAIRQGGGIVDADGSLSGMDLPFGIVRNARRIEGQGALGGGMTGNPDANFYLETVFESLVDAGYFPELVGQDIRDLDAREVMRQAIEDEMAGRPRFANALDDIEAQRLDALAEAADEFERAGIDVQSMTNQEIREELARRERAEQARGRTFAQAVDQQAAAVPEVRDDQGRLLAPNGQPSNLTEGQWRAVRTPEFKAWFGDWEGDPANASKVVDANGEPLVVYHGTPDARGLFTAEGAFQARPGADAAFFFTDRRGVALTYADDSRAFDYQNARPAVGELFLNIREPVETDARGRSWGERGGPSGQQEQISAAREAGGDGLIIRNTLDTYNVTGNERGSVFVAFEPTQIKSAQDGPVTDLFDRSTIEGSGPNRGTFDPADPRILYQSAYHGSPHIFDRFSTDAMGTGEGNQAFGWGLYFASERGVARWYRETLKQIDTGAFDRAGLPPGQWNAATMFARQYASNEYEMAAKDFGNWVGREITPEIVAGFKEAMEPAGRLYTVEIPDDGDYLLWDRPLSEQPKAVLDRAMNVVRQAADIYSDVRSDDVRLRELARDAAQFMAAVESGTATGEGLYRTLQRLTGDMRQASLELSAAGIPGIKYLDGGSRPGGEGSYNYVIFDDRLIDIVEYEQSTRGFIDFSGQQTRVVLSPRADRSTFLHEMGHLFLEDLFALRGRAARVDRDLQGVVDWWRGNAADVAAEASAVNPYQVRRAGSQFVVQGAGVREVYNTRAEAEAAANKRPRPAIDAETVIAFLEGDMNGSDVTSLMIRTALHEQFARGFETYLMDGKAPSLSLRAAFEMFADWLTRIYRRLRGDLSVRLTDDFRGVLDGMLASQDEIAAAREDASAQMAFATQDDAGMTGDEWSEYLDVSTQARQAENKRVRDQFVRAEQARIKAEADGVKAEIREQVSADADRTPTIRALHWLSKGEWLGDPDDNPFAQHLRLDRSAVVALVNEEGAKRLARSNGGSGQTIYTRDRGGVHPDLVAGAFGFDSGEAMLRALIDHPSRKAWIDARTDEVFRERYGDPVSDGTAEQQAQDAIHRDERGRLLEVELRFIARKAGQPEQTPRQAARTAAERAIARMPVARALRADRFLQAERRAGAEAQAALARNDADAAFQAKLRQVQNHYMYRAARAFRREFDAGMRKVEQSQRATVGDKKRATVEFNFHMAARFVFSRYGLANEPRTFNFAEWQQRLADEDPDAVRELIAVMDTAQSQAKPYREMSADEFRDLIDVANNLLAVGRAIERTKLENEDVEIAAAQTEIRDALVDFHGEGGPGQALGRQDLGAQAAFKFGSIKAAMTRMADYARSVDGGNGPLTRLIFQPMQEAANRYTRARMDMQVRVRDILRPILREQTGKIVAPELGGVTFASKSEVIAAILNTGSESSRDRLFGGWQATYSVDVTPEAWLSFQERLMREGKLTRADYDAIRQVWDTFEELRPQALAAYKAMYGKEFGYVEPIEVETPLGLMPGGYYPAKYDSTKSPTGAQNLDVELDNQSGILGGFGGVDSFTKARNAAPVVAPMDLNLELLGSALDKELRFIHLLPTARSIMRIVNRQDFKRSLQNVNPHFVDKLVQPFLQRAVSQTVTTQGTNALDRNLGRALSAGRTIASLHIMAGNIRNAIEQATGIFPASSVVGSRRLAAGFAQYYANPAATLAEIKRLSPDFEARLGVAAQDAQEESRALIREASRTGRIAELAVRHSYVFQRAMMHVTEPAVWIAAFNKATEAGMSESQAALEAERTVNRTQGTGNPLYVSQFEVGPPSIRMLLMFYSFFNSTFNAALSEYRVRTRDAGKVKQMAAGLSIYASFVLLPATISEVLRVAFNGVEDDDDDGPVDDLLAQIFWGNVGFVAAAIPFAGPGLATALQESFGEGYARYSISPITLLFERTGDLGKGLTGALEILEGDATPATARNAAKGALLFAPGGNYLGNLIGYSYGVGTGQLDEPESLGDLLTAYSTGRERPE